MPPSTGTQDGGTIRYLIRTITVTPGSLDASICTDGWDQFAFTTDGTLLDAQTALSVETLTMRKLGSKPQTTPSIRQQSLMADESTDPTPTGVGRTPYDTWLKGPKDNVFNGWIAESWDVSVEPPADCISWFKHNHPGLNFPTGYPNEARPNKPASPPPPTLPSSPGW